MTGCSFGIEQELKAVKYYNQWLKYDYVFRFVGRFCTYMHESQKIAFFKAVQIGI